MICKKECIAMLLAGGQGSRLCELTYQTAKPAVTYGAKYKIIDFPLSNCIHSGIDTVGVLTQYQPLALNEYIGNGEPWDLDRARGGLSVLPPYQGHCCGEWYKGTANAIYQNLNFVRRYAPAYVLILSADHIYRMDYSKMLRRHKISGAACTVATVTVPMEEAGRFGICNTDEEGAIVEFEEKPLHPKNDQASMGIYIFNTQTLIRYLEADEADEFSAHDFGKNIIPTLLAEGEKLYAYRFDGYWRDVGTIASLWEANMDLLGENPLLRLDEGDFRICSRHLCRAPQYIGGHATIRDSLVSEGLCVYGTVCHSVLSAGVVVEEGAQVHDSVIMEDVVIRRGAQVYTAIVDAEARIESGAYVGIRGAGKSRVSVVGRGVRIDASACEVH